MIHQRQTRVDIHVHAIGIGNGSKCFISPRQRKTAAGRLLERYLNLLGFSEEDLDEQYLETLTGYVKDSPLDKVVLLALDCCYDSKGRLDKEASPIYVPNDYVLSAAERYEEFLAGVSVNPNRPDALEELERCAEQGAVLVKLVPSVHNFDPGRPKYREFYEKLKELDLVLLIHTGIEHTLPSTDQSYNDPQELVPALAQGVTVIAAHCGAANGKNDPAYLESFIELASMYPNLYGDVSAITNKDRLNLLLEEVSDKLLYGSDFPAPPISPGSLSPSSLWKGLRTQSPLLRHYQVREEMGVPEEVFERAATLLRSHLSPES